MKKLKALAAIIAKVLLFFGTKIVTEEMKVVKRGNAYYVICTSKLFTMPVADETFKVKDLAVSE